MVMMMTVLTTPKGPPVIYWGWTSASACEPTSNLCMASFKDLYVYLVVMHISLGFGTKNTCCYSGTFVWRWCTCLRCPQNYSFQVCSETRHVFNTFWSALAVKKRVISPCDAVFAVPLCTAPQGDRALSKKSGTGAATWKSTNSPK